MPLVMERTLPKSFGEWLRERRIDAKLSQEELAEAVGVSKAYISNIERNQPHPRSRALPDPTFGVLMNIAEALRLRPVYVIRARMEAAGMRADSLAPMQFLDDDKLASEDKRILQDLYDKFVRDNERRNDNVDNT